MTMENWEQEEIQVKRPKRKLNWSALIVSLLILMVSFGIGFAGVQLFTNSVDQDNNYAMIDEKEPRVKAPDEPIHILLLGTDARKGEKVARTDTLILASVDVKNRKAAVLSIPRDTLVNIPGHGKDKVNAATVYGGPELAKETVEDIVGIDIDYYAMTNFSGFENVIDVLGGVTIDVERNMRYRDRADGTNINLKKGVQRLGGKEALDYSRFRADALGDIGRTARQQKMLKAVADEMLQLKTIAKLPRLIPEINEVLDTNLPLTEMLKLASLAKDLNNVEIVSQTLPGQFYNNRGSYWRYDAVIAKKVVPGLLAGETFPMITGADINEKPRPSVVAKKEEPKIQLPESTPQPKVEPKEEIPVETPVKDVVVPQPGEGAPSGQQPLPTEPQPTQPQPSQPQPGKPTQPSQPQPGPIAPTQPQPGQNQPNQPVQEEPAPEVNDGSTTEPMAPQEPAKTTSGSAGSEKKSTDTTQVPPETNPAG